MSDETPAAGDDDTPAEQAPDPDATEGAEVEAADAAALADTGRADDLGAEEVADDQAADSNEPYQRRVAVVLALLAVLGAWIGILHADAGTSESFYARETTRTAVASLRANVNQATVQGLDVDLDAERQSLALTAPFRQGADSFSALGGGEPTEAELAAELDQAESEVEGLDRSALARAQEVEAERLDLKRSALAETRVTYNNRASQYETVLTTLGVALFLVGFTLVLRRRTRPPILVPGVLLAVYVFGWALWIHHREVPDTADAAIAEAAEGGTDLFFGEPAAAVDHYDAAIAIDDDFVAAYSGRSYAAWQDANPDFATTLAVVDTDSERADQARADAEEANRLGQDRDFQGLILAGAYAFYDGDFEQAIDRFELAVEANDRAPEAYVLIAASELALGHDEAAAEALDEATALLDTQEASQQTRQISADLLTFLEFVEQTVPERAESVDAVRAELIAAESGLTFDAEVPGTLPAGATVGLDELGVVQADDGATSIALAVSYADLPDDTQVSMYLYEQPAEDAAFVQAAELARFAALTGSGEVAGTATIERQCTPVALRLDVYLDGVLAESFDAPGGDPTC